MIVVGYHGNGLGMCYAWVGFSFVLRRVLAHSLPVVVLRDSVSDWVGFIMAMGCVWVGLWVGLSVDIAHYVRLIGYACK